MLRLPEWFIDIQYPGLNLVARERLDPVIRVLANGLGLSHSQLFYFIVQQLIFTGSVFWLLRQSQNLKAESYLRSALGALIVVASLILVLGADPFMLKVQWLPLLISMLIAFRRQGSLLAFVGVVVAMLLWVFTGGVLAPLGVLAAGFAAVLWERWSLAEEARSAQTLFILACGLALSVWCLPVYPMPNYPAGALVAPISQLMFRESPLFGFSLTPNPLVYSEYLHSIWIVGFRLSVFLLTLLAVIQQTERRRECMAGYMVIVVTMLMIIAEGREYTALASLLPFQVLRFTIPGLAISNLPWMLAPFALVVGLVLILGQLGHLAKQRLGAALVLLFALQYATSDCRFNFAWSGVNHFARALSATDNLNERLRVSPSGYAIKIFGDSAIDKSFINERGGAPLVELKLGADFNGTVTASAGKELAELALDGKLTTNWNTQRNQRPGDTVEVQFEKPVTVARVKLGLDNVPTDFPRGITVLLSTDGVNFRELYNFRDWPGRLQWTDSGYPYFGSQSDVVFELPKSETVKAMRFIQTSSNDIFDWSISEIQLFRLP